MEKFRSHHLSNSIANRPIFYENHVQEALIELGMLYVFKKRFNNKRKRVSKILIETFFWRLTEKAALYFVLRE
jgi:hypothetical protein